ncbi:hypothetical protein SELMODRAFT_409709 [Selaginella moellendorffii]|uniref:Uncharacterized protein n=1 Tax=Selaginella moellendorffii TaxID=88036 RepID=D8RC70_SELML|nr:hypothetical protein SELMODRAFT_409709 [Selaginella moellendorffii]
MVEMLSSLAGKPGEAYYWNFRCIYYLGYQLKTWCGCIWFANNGLPYYMIQRRFTSGLELLAYTGRFRTILVVCIINETSETRFLVGNPLTHQWVTTAPPLKSSVQCRRSFMLIPYMSEGSMFFRIAIDPYLFDSKVGIWTLPSYQTIWTLSSNTLHIQGVQYGLGCCEQHSAVVLLEVDDLGALSEAKWLWAWDMDTLPSSYPYMLEIGGEIGLLAATRWFWCWTGRVDMLYKWQSYVLSVGMQVVVFDSQRMTWELVGKRLLRTMELLVWVPDFAAVPNANTPNEKLKQSCASKYSEASFGIRPAACGTFAEVEAVSKRGMTWQQIGELAVDRNKGGIFKLHLIA